MIRRGDARVEALQLEAPHPAPAGRTPAGQVDHDTAGEAAGQLYLVTPYVTGGSLRDRLAREGPLPIRDALRRGGGTRGREPLFRVG